MAQSAFFRFGEQELVKQKVDSASVIEIGDVLFLDTDDVKPASAFTWTSNLATTQVAFAKLFIGIACESSASGQTSDISVDISTRSVWEFTVASAAFEMTDELGCDENSSALADQTLEKTASDTYGIAKPYGYSATTTRLKVKFASAFNVSSSNVSAQIG